MTDTLKCLGQAYPPGSTLFDLYTAPRGTQARVTALIACNQSPSISRVRVSHSLGIASDERKHYLVWDCALLPYESKQLLPDALSMSPAGVLRVLSDSGAVSFNLTGVEIT